MEHRRETTLDGYRKRLPICWKSIQAHQPSERSSAPHYSVVRSSDHYSVGSWAGVPLYEGEYRTHIGTYI